MRSSRTRRGVITVSLAVTVVAAASIPAAGGVPTAGVSDGSRSQSGWSLTPVPAANPRLQV